MRGEVIMTRIVLLLYLIFYKKSPKIAHILLKYKKSPLKKEISIKKRFESVCKPSSVVYGHLSRLIVTDKLKRYSRRSVGRTALLTEAQSCSEWGLHGIPCYQDIGELLPRLSILTANGQACCQAVQNRS